VDSPDGSRQPVAVSPSRSRDGTDVRRPSPRGSRAEQIRAWSAWFGFRRLIGSAIAVMVVCAGVFWLVRTPPPPTEALLPLAATSTSATSVSTATVPASAPPAGSPSVASTVPATAVVHVAGAVVSAGVYRVDAGARVDEAITLAGGPTPDADTDVVNLAAVVVDGSRIYVPRVGEAIPPALAPAGSNTPGSGAAGSSAPSGPQIVDVNVAAIAELDELPGVGPATAAAIVAERERNGPFVGVDDLDRVPGIGPAKLEALRDLVTT
jgi:competence protein ComEA